MPKLADTFAQLRAKKQIALMPFIPAGYPDLETTAACLPALEKGGASIIEIGIPFSDPIADGPIIQEAFMKALGKKLKLADIFATIKKARPTVSIPLMAMVSYSIVFRHGVERFCKEAKEAGFDGLILPDLPLPESESVANTVQSTGLDTIFLIAPTSAPDRRKHIARLCSGFVYYLSISGITGERDQLPQDLADNVTNLKSLSDRPICVGFGINKPQHVAQLASVADGAIVGSAVVRRMVQHEKAGPAAIAKSIEDYTRELLTQVR
ncbi:MAG TPA: tryptophan synthase subunit alpha [Tepidisphaeraceae bacterium]|jgi:tryptophan synthase alpha chain